MAVFPAFLDLSAPMAERCSGGPDLRYLRFKCTVQPFAELHALDVVGLLIDDHEKLLKSVVHLADVREKL